MTDPFDSYASYLQVLNSLVQASGPTPLSSMASTANTTTTTEPQTSSLMSQEEQTALQRELSLWQSTNFTQMDSTSPTVTSPIPSSSSSSQDPSLSSPTKSVIEEEEHLDFFRLAPEDRQHIVTTMDHQTAFALLDPCALPSQTKVPKAALSTQPIPIAPSPFTHIPPPSNAHVISSSQPDLNRRANLKSTSAASAASKKKASATLSASKKALSSSSATAGPTPPSALSAPLPNNKRKRSSPSLPPPLTSSPHPASTSPRATSLGDLDPAQWVLTPEGDIISVDEDKRRRNTAASARFRQKKKLRESELEKTAEEQTDRANALQSRVDQLEQEVKWLKGLLVEKDPSLLGLSKSSQVAAE